MKAFVCEGFGHVHMTEIAQPVIQEPNDALIRVTMTSICGSDVQLVNGQIPTEPGFIMGHELVGVVEDVGSAVQTIRPGDRVAVPASPFCGHCANCLAGEPRRCLNGGVLGSGWPWGGWDGAHSEYVCVPFADLDLVKIPDTVSDEQALFVGDILSTGYYAVKKAGLRHGETLVVMGSGPVGLCAIHTARLFAPSAIIAVDLLDYRLEVARQLGATATINARQTPVVDRVLELTDGLGANVIVDAAGAPATLQQSVMMAAVGGRIAMVGYPSQPIELPLERVFTKNLNLSMGLANLDHMHALIHLIEGGQIDTTPLITHHFRLDEIETAFRLVQAQQDNVIKVAITP